MIEFWDLNWWAIIVSAIATFVFGMLWYGPLFGKTWMRLTGIIPSDDDKKGMGCKMIIAFLANAVFAWGLAVLIVNLGIVSIALAFCIASTIWGCFVTMNYLNSVLWERTSLKLFFFNSAYNLLAVLIMASILVNWQ